MRISSKHAALFSGKTIVRNRKPCRAPTGEPGRVADKLLKQVGAKGIAFETYMAEMGGSGRGIRRLHVLHAAGALDLLAGPAKAKSPRKAKAVEVVAVEAPAVE